MIERYAVLAARVRQELASLERIVDRADSFGHIPAKLREITKPPRFSGTSEVLSQIILGGLSVAVPGTE
ncbi:MAG: hypothetical protein Kow0063_31160 [Anaerolineae bacterium]